MPLFAEPLMLLTGEVVCLLAANRGSNCSMMRTVDGRILRRGIISLCQSAATSEIEKRFWSRICLIVRSATERSREFKKVGRTESCNFL